MNKELETDLRKVTAVTTLYHLCPLEFLEKLAAEVKFIRQPTHIKKDKNTHHQNTSKTKNND